MIRLSNADAKTLRRLLARLQGTAGDDTTTKNVRRQAHLLSKKIDRKINEKR
jgi:uncharacterized protein (UPF0147 family)